MDKRASKYRLLKPTVDGASRRSAQIREESMDTFPEIARDPDGFLADPAAWTRETAVALAAAEGLGELGEEHWRVIEFIRAHWTAKGVAPMIRVLCRETGRIGIPTTHSTLSPLPNPTPVAPRHRLAYSLHRRTPGEDPESAQPGITRPEPGRTTPPAAYIERLCCISIS